jgi:hypothetical protein
MSEGEAAATANVEPIGLPERSTIVTDELNRIGAAVRTICPDAAAIGFEFDGKLRINIDLRRLEDVARLEVVLPTLCGGAFSAIQRGLVDNHPFLHRLTALVDR